MDEAGGKAVKLLYFAWVRERIGAGEETLVLPASVTTVAALIAWLASRGHGYAEAFKTPAIIRAAIDRVHARHEASISGAREIAFFPPVTGG